jgi:hypothetical protein
MHWNCKGTHNISLNTPSFHQPTPPCQPRNKLLIGVRREGKVIFLLCYPSDCICIMWTFDCDFLYRSFICISLTCLCWLTCIASMYLCCKTIETTQDC